MCIYIHCVINFFQEMYAFGRVLCRLKTTTAYQICERWKNDHLHIIHKAGGDVLRIKEFLTN